MLTELRFALTVAFKVAFVEDIELGGSVETVGGDF
jgi:hypothetical protein